jgi:energy-converting hydrogenase Eha subunit F
VLLVGVLIGLQFRRRSQPSPAWVHHSAQNHVEPLYDYKSNGVPSQTPVEAPDASYFQNEAQIPVELDTSTTREMRSSTATRIN